MKQKHVPRLPLDAYGIDSSRRRLFADFSDDEGIVEEPAVSAASRFPNYGARSRDHPDERVPEFLAALYLILARFFAWMSREEAFQSHFGNFETVYLKLEFINSTTLRCKITCVYYLVLKQPPSGW